jgi:hypothetical protein
MKMISEKEDGGKLSSWKVYYAVLSNGFLLLYKEGHAKSKVSPLLKKCKQSFNTPLEIFEISCTCRKF